MKKLAILILLLCLFLLISCEKYKEKIVFQNEYVANSKLIDNSPFIGISLSLSIKNDILFITDFHGDELLTIYDLKNENVVGKIAPRGKGPKEFISPIFATLTDSALSVFDKGKFRVGYYNLKNVENHLSYVYFDLFEVPTSIIDLIPLDNQSFLAAGYFENGRYAIVDKKGIKKNDYFGSYPNFLNNEYKKPFEAKAMFHQPAFTANYADNLIASISSHVLEIIDFSSSVPKIVKSIQLANYDYNYISGEFLQTDATNDTPKGVVRVITSTNSYIYMIYNPNTANTKPTERKNNEIWVFDWKGNPVKKLLPKINIERIVASKDNALYGITHDPEPTIVKIEIIKNDFEQINQINDQ